MKSQTLISLILCELLVLSGCSMKSAAPSAAIPSITPAVQEATMLEETTVPQAEIGSTGSTESADAETHPIVENNATEITTNMIMEPAFSVVRRSIPFAASKTTLGPIGKKVWNEILPLAIEAKSVQVRGRTDISGVKDANKDLARQRAVYVRSMLIAAGVPVSNIKTTYCTSCFIADNKTAAGRKLNRRVDVDLELFESRVNDLSGEDYKPVLTLTKQVGMELTVVALR